MSTSGTVDQRIVEMQIDHEKFESGAKKTIGILESLDKSLKSLGSSNVDGFDEIGGALDKVTNKISVFGTVGDQIIRNLTTKAMEFASQLNSAVSSLTTAQISAGWSKYADKTQAVQTIMAATSKDWTDTAAQMEYVNEQLDKLNWFTDETSYSFLDMVNNIGKFTSNGVKLDTAVTAMQGISTWAALSGANVNEAGRAMYNLSQAMSTGSVKLIDWKSIENANMATLEFKETALETAVAMGVLTKTSNNMYKTASGKEFSATQGFNTYLSEGWFTSDVLTKTLEQYGDFTNVLKEATDATGLTATEMLQAVEAYKKGEEGLEDLQEVCASTGVSLDQLKPHLETLSSDTYDLGYRAFKAAQEAKTFKEAVDAVKEAAATGWMNIFETIFGDYLQAKEVWTDLANSLYEVFVEPLNQIQELVKWAFGDWFNKEQKENTVNANFDEMVELLGQAGYSMDQFGESFKEVDKNKLTSLVEEYGSLEAAIKAGAVDADTFTKVLKNLAGISDETAEAITTASYSKTDSKGNVYTVLANSAKKLVERSQEAKDALDELMSGASKYTNTEELEQAKTGSELFTESFLNLVGVLEDVTTAASTAMQILFGDNSDPENPVEWTRVLGENLYTVLERFNEFTKALRLNESEDGEISTLAQNIANIVSILITARNVVHSVFSFIWKIITGVATAVKNSGLLSSVGNAILSIFNGLLAVIMPVYDYISDFINKLNEENGETSWVEQLTYWLSILGGYIETAAAKFREFMETKVAGKVLDVVTRLVGLFDRMRNAFKENGIAGAWEVLTESINNFLQRHPKLLKALNVIKTVFTIIGGAVMLVASAIGFLVSKIITFVSFISSAFSEGGIKAVFDKIIGKLQETFKDNPKLVAGLESVKEKISRIVDVVSNFIDKIRNFGERLKEAFQENGIAGVFDVIKQEIDEFLERHPKLAAFITWVGNAFTTVANAISNAWTNIKTFISGIDFEEIFSKLPSLSDVGAFFTNIYNSIIGWFADLKEKIKNGDFVGVFQSIIDGISNAFSNVKIGAGKIKDVFSNIFSKLGLGDTLLESINNMSESLKNVAIVGILFKVRQLIRNISWVFDEFSGLIGVPRLNAIRKIIIALGITILMLAGALWIVSQINPDQLAPVWDKLVSLIVIIVAAISIIKTLKAEGAVASLAGVLIAVALLAGVVYLLSKMSEEDFESGFEKLETLLGSIARFLVVMMVVSKVLGSNGVGAGSFGSLIGVAVLVGVCAIVLNKLSGMTAEDFENGANRLKALLRLVEVLILVMAIGDRISGASNDFKRLLFVSILVAVCAVITYQLSKMSQEDFENGINRLQALLRLVEVLILVTAIASRIGSGGNVKAGTFLSLVVMIVAVIVVARLLKDLVSLEVSENKFLKVAGSLAICLIAIAAAMTIISHGTKNFGLRQFAALAVGVLAFVAIGVVLKKLSDQDWKQMATIAAVILAVIVIIIVILTICGGIGSTMFVGAVLLSACLIVLAAALWVVMQIGKSTMSAAIDVAEKLDTFMTKLQPFLDKIQGLTGSDAAKIALFAGILLELAVVELISAVNTILSYLYDSDLIGDKLTTLITHLWPFLEKVKELDASYAIKIGIFSSLLKAIAGIEVMAFVNTVLSWIYDSDLIGDKLTNLINHLSPFLTKIESLSIASLTYIAILKQILEAVKGVEGRAFIDTVGAWIYDSDLIGDKLSNLIAHLTPFLTEIEGLNIASLIYIAILKQILDAIKGVEGRAFIDTVGAWIYDSDLIGDKLANLVDHLQPFLTKIESLSATSVAKVLILKNILKNVAKAEVWSAFAGLLSYLSNSERVGQKLGTFMHNMEPFFTNIKDVPENAVTDITNLSTILKEVAKGEFWSAITGFISKWKEKHDLEGLDKVAENLSTFVTDLEPFFTMLNSLDPNTFPNADSFLSFVQDVNRNNALTAFGDEVGNFYFALTNVDVDKVSSVLKTTTEFVNSIIQARDLISSSGSFSSDFLTNLVSAITSVSEDPKLSTDGQSVGNSIVSAIALGIALDKETISTQIASTAGDAATDASNDEVMLANANAIGENIASGIANGITSSIGLITAAAIAAAAAATNAFSGPNGINAHSPSRVFARLGSFIPAGVAEGVQDNIGAAEDSMTIMGSAVVAAMEMAMAKVATVADDDFEFNPTITPVVDLSNVSSAAGGAASILGGISPMMRGSLELNTDRAQNTAATFTSSKGPTTSDSIQGLSDKLDALAEAMTNMQIVLDSGELVGATSQKMDSAFGVMQMRRERGN